MKFGLLYEIALPRPVAATGKTESDAYWEAIEPIRFAEELGFDSVWAVGAFVNETTAAFCMMHCRKSDAVARERGGKAAGFDHYFALVRYGTLTHEGSRASLRTFAEKVMPRFA